MINTSQQVTINTYLQSVGIEQMELFEELYDHIATSYENRTDIDQSLEVHIRREVATSFGGKKGIKKLRNVHRWSTAKAFSKKLGGLFLEHFYKWPYILITAASVLLLVYLAQDTVDYQLHTNTFLICMVIPFFAFTNSINKFSKECKNTNKPYTKSWVNEMIFVLFCAGIILMYGLTYLASLIVLPSPGIFDMIRAYPWLTIPLGTLHLIHAVACYRLYRQDFRIKLDIAS